MFGLLSLLMHVAAVAATAATTYLFFDPASTFAYHPVLMSAAYLLFMAEGAMTAISFRTLVGEARVKAIWRHMYWTTPGNLLMIGGFYAIYSVKTQYGKDHFTTNHGKLGLMTMTMSLGGQVGGALSFRALGLNDMLPVSMRGTVKTLHRNFGFINWFLALGCILLGLRYEHMSKGVWTPMLQAAVAGMAGVMLILSAVGPPKAKDAAKAQ